MNKLIEKLKTLLPNTKNKIIFSFLLYLSCVLFSFTQINNFNISSIALTILLCCGIALLIFGVILFLIFSLPKFLNASINYSQYYLVFSVTFSVELFIFSLVSFLSNLYSPLLFLVLGMICLIAITWFNILFQFKYLAPLIGKNEKTLSTIKLYNILIVCIILAIWFIL